MIPEKLCKCGCGIPIKREQSVFIKGHNTRRHTPGFHPEDRGFESECWVWHGSVLRGGYGTIQVASKSIKAHRFMYEMMVGKIPEGFELDHLCRTRSCVRPDHLEPVTHAENMRRGCRSKLSHDDVSEIKALLAGDLKRGDQAAIARRFGVTPQMIHRIKIGDAWK